jgi:hypothetical protein
LYDHQAPLERLVKKDNTTTTTSPQAIDAKKLDSSVSSDLRTALATNKTGELVVIAAFISLCQITVN